MEFNDENKDLILAATIHPKFKTTWISTERNREYAQALIINAYITAANERTTNESTPTTQESVNSDDTESRFFNRLRNNNERRTSTDDSLTFDVWKYLLQTTEEEKLSLWDSGT